MTALVTGAAGFIGSHLSESLVSKGYSVIGVDNFCVGRRENLSSINPERFRLIEADLSNRDLIDLLGESPSIDYVFHLGALADIVPSISSPRDYFEANTVGTLNILEVARTLGVKKFVYAASSSCYGLPSVFPTPETSPISPMYPYALTKYLGEELALHWNKVYKLPVISLRLFNVYGPRARTSGTYGAVMGVFLAQKLAHAPLTIVGDGTQTRDFTYVSDVVNAFVMAAESNIESGIFNVGSGGTYSINQLAKLIGGQSVQLPKRPGEPDCTFANIEKISHALGWEPKIGFEEGVNLLLDQISRWEDAPVWTPQKIEKQTELWFKYLANDKQERDS